MKRYPEYKESGVEFIGEIPKDWHLTKLKYIAQIDNSGLWGEEQGMLDIDAPVSTTAHLTPDGDWLIEQMPIRSFSKADYEYYSGKNGDIIIVKSSGSATNIITGKAGFIDNISKGIVFSNFLMRVKPNQEKYEPKLLYYFLTSFITKERVKQIVSTTTYPNLKVEEYISKLIPIPFSKDEQIKIINFLDHKTGKIDELTRIKERQVELLHEYRASLIQQTVTKGLDPNVEMKPSGVDQIGEIPAHWEVKPVKHIALFIGGYSEFGSESYTDSGIPIFRIGDIAQSIKMEKVKRVPIQQVKRLQQNQLCHGDTLIVMIGRRAGESTYYAFDYPSILSAQVAGLRATKVDSKFLFYFIHSASFLHTVTPLFFGATRDNISKTALMGVKIPFPPNSEQKEIAAFLDRKTGQIDKLIALEGRKIELLKEYRQSLISHVVTGKIDVRNEV